MATVDIDSSSAILESASKWMRARGWHELLGKQRQYTQSLFHHVLVQLNFLTAIRPLLCDHAGFSLTHEQFFTLLVGNLCHDVGKEEPSWQEAVRKGTKPPDHVHYEKTRKAIEEWVELLGLASKGASFTATVLAAIGLHHKATQGPASTLGHLFGGDLEDPRWRELADLVEATDKICSAGTVAEAAAEAEKRFGNGLPHPKFSVTLHRIQILRGVSTTFLHKACQDAHVQRGWTPVLHFADGTLYFALASDNAPVPDVKEVRQRLGILFDQLLNDTNLVKEVVGQRRKTFLAKPELFNSDPDKFSGYLKEAAWKNNPASYISRHRKKSGVSNRHRQNVYKYKGESASEDEVMAEVEKFANAGKLADIFAFFKACVLGEKSLVADHLTGDLWKQFKEISQSKLDDEFGKNTYQELTSLTNNDPVKDRDFIQKRWWSSTIVRNGQTILRESSPLEDQVQDLIRILSKLYKDLYPSWPMDYRPEPMDGAALSETFIADLLQAYPVAPMNAELFLEAYVNSKEETKGKFCPASNQPREETRLSRDDLGVKPDSHSNRLKMQSRTWKDRGGIGLAKGSRYEFMLRRLILGVPTKQLIVLIPPMQLGPFEGQGLVGTVQQLEQDIALHSREYSANPIHRFSFSLTDQIARRLRADQGASLAVLLSYTSASETAKEHKRNLDKGLQEAFGPTDDGDHLKNFNQRHGATFKNWAEARKHKDLAKQADSEFLQLAVASLNEECGTSFQTWDEVVEAIYLGQSDDAKKALANSDEIRERRRQALKFREPGQFVCQTPNVIFVLLPETVKVGDESDANASIRQLFLSLVIANSLGVSVALLDAEEALTFTGGEGTIRIPRNAALRAEVGRVRRNWTALGKPVGSSPTHEWLLPHEITPWLQALAVLHFIANIQDANGQRLYPERSALFETLSARSPGALLRRIENTTKRAISPVELDQLASLEPFLG